MPGFASTCYLVMVPCTIIILLCGQHFLGKTVAADRGRDRGQQVKSDSQLDRHQF